MATRFLQRGVSGLAVGVAATLAVTLPAAAGPASAWVETKQSAVRLISAADAVGAGGQLQVGLQFRLNPGWKIYWRSPGDAGVPPVLDWKGSDNLRTAVIGWPLPRRFNLYGLDTFGYEGEVVLPIEAELVRPGQPVTLRLAVNYGICKEVCIPYDAVLSLTLPAGPARESAFAPVIQRYAERVPKRGPDADFALGSVRFEQQDGAPVLVVQASAKPGFRHPDLLIEGPDGVRFAIPVVTLNEGGVRAEFRAAADLRNAPAGLGAMHLVLTLVDGARAIERQVDLDPMR